MTTSSAYVNGQDYVLQFPVKAEFAMPAYKKRVVANTTHSNKSKAPPSDNDLTDYENGHVMFVDGTYGTNTGARFSLAKPDGFKLHKVIAPFYNDTANASIQSSANNITDRFDFDSGQRDMFYDNASIILKPDADAPTGNADAADDATTASTTATGATNGPTGYASGYASGRTTRDDDGSTGRAGITARGYA